MTTKNLAQNGKFHLQKMLAVFIAILVLAVSAYQAHAGVSVWTGSSDTLWNNNGNWTGTVTPPPTGGTTNDIYFCATGAINLTNAIAFGGRAVRSLNFTNVTAANVKIYLSGTTNDSTVNALHFNGGGAGASIFIDSATTANIQIGVGNGNPRLLDNLSITNSSSSAVLTFGRAIQNNAAGANFSLSKWGVGKVVLGGSNIYTNGVTTVNEGTLELSGNNTGCNGGLTINGGILRFVNANALCLGTFTVNGGSLDTDINVRAFTGASYTTSSYSQVWNSDFTFLAQRSLNMGVGPVTLGNNVQITVSAPTTANVFPLTIGGAIGGGYSLTKAGGGILWLQGANTYTGGTTVSAGLLLLSGSLSSSGTVAVNGGTFTGTGTVGGAVTLSSGGTIAPGITTTNTGAVNGTTTNSVGILTLNSHLTLNSGGSLVFKITNAATADKLVVGGDLIIPSGTTAISLPNTTPLTNGDYTLIEVTGSLGGSAANFSVTSPSPTKTYSIAYQSGAPNKVVLQVSNGGIQALTWTGDGGANLWDTTATNWLNSGSPSVFNTNDTVTFDAIGNTNPIVNIPARVEPSSVTVNASTDYTFTGAGYISGTNTLTKSGSGALTVSTVNDYNGGTVINGGTVKLGANNPLGTGKVTLIGPLAKLSSDGSTARLLTNNLVMTTNASFGDSLNAGTLTLSGVVDLVGPSGAARNLTNASKVIVTGSITNGSGVGAGVPFTKFGAGEFVVAGNSDFLGSGTGVTKAQEGTFTVDGATLTLLSGVFQLKGTVPNSVVRLVVTNGGSLLNTATNLNWRAGTTGGDPTTTNIMEIAGMVKCLGTPGPSDGIRLFVGYDGTIGVVNLWPGGDLSMRDISANGGAAVNAAVYSEFNFRGGILRAIANNGNFISSLTNCFVGVGGGTIDSGTNTITVSQWLRDGSEAVPAIGSGGLTKVGSGTLILTATNTYVGNTTISNGTLQLGNGSSSGAVAGNITNHAALVAYPGTDGQIIANTISGSGTFAKTGPGMSILTGANTYTGATVVSNGTLVVNGSLASGSAVTVKTGSTLAAVGSIGGSVTVETGAILAGTNGVISGAAALNGGILSPGIATNDIASLTINNTLTLDASSVTLMDISKSSATNDQVKGMGTVTFGGTMTVTNLGGTFAPGDSFQLFSASSYAGNFSATNLPPLDTGLKWNWSAANGTLSVASSSTYATTTTNLVFTVSLNSLSLTWPSSHLGWYAQSNAVDLANPSHWHDIPGSQLVTNLDITLDAALLNVFYRLRMPP